MKKALTLGLAVLALSPQAFATKARLLALGEDTNGSLYIKDQRNMFFNPAYIHMNPNLAVFEWGANGYALTKQDSQANPQAEGGLLRDFGGFVAGAYYGGESDIVNEIRRNTVVGPGSTNFQQDNQIDLFFGGGDSLKWAGNLTYSSSKNEQQYNAEQKSLSLRTGIIMDNIEALLNVSLMNEAEMHHDAAATAVGNKSEFDGKLGFETGATYRMNDLAFYGYWRHAQWDQKSDTTSTLFSALAPTTTGAIYLGNADGTSNKFRFGTGWTKEVTGGTLFSHLAFNLTTRTLKTNRDGDIKINDWILPVTVGYETRVQEWLTLRGSVTQNIWSGEDNKGVNAASANISNAIKGAYKNGKKTTANSTNVNAGATLHFGNLAVDGAIGTDLTTTTNSTSDAGVLRTDTLLTRVGVTYSF
jgi:hypothetical protein